MIKHKKGLFTLAIFLIFFFACNNPKNFKNKRDEIQNFKKEIPTDKRGDYFPSYYLIKKYTKKAELRNLENGFDSICIRLWYIYGIGSSWQVVEIKKNSKEWLSEFILLTADKNKKDSSTRIQKSILFEKPKSGWDVFTKELFNYNITTLPTDELIKGYKRNTDGHFVIVEIATEKYYRIFNYSDLNYNSNIKEARVISDIMKLVEREFGVERLHKDF